MRYGAAFIICFPGLKRARDDAAVLIESNGCGGVAGVAQHVTHALVLFLRVQHIPLLQLSELLSGDGQNDLLQHPPEPDLPLWQQVFRFSWSR